MKLKYLFWSSAACMMISSLSVLLMPFGDFSGNGGQKALGYVCGVVFWLFLAAGALALKFTYRKLKAEGQEDSTAEKGRPAIFTFFSSRPAAAADIVLAVSFLWNILSAAGIIKLEFLNIVSASALFMSFHLHYMLNGKAFAYISKKFSQGRNKGGKNEKQKN